MIADRSTSSRSPCGRSAPSSSSAATPGASAIPGTPVPQQLVLHGQNHPNYDPSSSLSLPTSDDSAGPIVAFAGDRPVDSMEIGGIHVSQTNVQNNMTFEYHDDQQHAYFQQQQQNQQNTLMD